MSLDRITEKESRSLYKFSKAVDTIDMIIGPLTALCYASGSEYLQTFGDVLSTVEIAGVKLPFTVNYLSKMKDAKALIFWVPKEIISNTYPGASIIDIAPVYKSRTKYMMKKKNRY